MDELKEMKKEDFIETLRVIKKLDLDKINTEEDYFRVLKRVILNSGQYNNVDGNKYLEEYIAIFKSYGIKVEDVDG